MADVAELNEQSTKEDITAIVDQIAEEVESDRAGDKPEGKSDAQITSEHADNEKPPVAEKKASDGTAKPAKGKGETPKGKTGEESESAESADWFDDDLKAEITAYGLKESDVADFASREELDRALRFFDKSALEKGRAAMAEAEPDGEAKGDTGRNEKGQFTKKPETPPAETKTDGQYEVGLSKDVYDEGLVGELTKMRDHYEARLQKFDGYEERFKALEARLIEADARADEQHFDSLVDSLDHADLFGKTGKETPEELQRRKDLHVQVRAMQNGLASLGRPADLDESLVNRVARMVFAEELSKKELKNRTRKISRQSNGRQGGGATRPQDPREDPRDEADRLYRELEGR